MEQQTQVNELNNRAQVLARDVASTKDKGHGKGQTQTSTLKRTLIDTTCIKIPELLNNVCHKKVAFNRRRKTLDTIMTLSTLDVAKHFERSGEGRQSLTTLSSQQPSPKRRKSSTPSSGSLKQLTRSSACF